MPRRIFKFDEPDRFVCGALGQPGVAVRGPAAGGDTKSPRVGCVSGARAQSACFPVGATKTV